MSTVTDAAAQPAVLQERQGTARQSRPFSNLPALLKRFALIPPFVALLLFSINAMVSNTAHLHGPGTADLGADFAMFYTATHVLQAHGTLYDPAILLRSENRLMHQQNIDTSVRLGSQVRVGNPPLFFWALGPLARLPYQMAAWIWFGAMALASLAGGLAAMRIAGWKIRPIPALLFLLMPVVSAGVYYGNNIPLVFVGLMLSLLIARRHPLLSGILMSIAWLNPSIALPLVMLIVLFHVRDRRAVLAGLVLATIALGGLSLLVLGSGSFVEWVAGLSRYSRDIASPTDIAPLSGVYIDHVSSAVRTVLEAASLVAALALTGWWWVRNRGRQASFGRTGWLWFAWFLATPYAHADDLILLAIPIMVMLGRDARHVLRFPGALAMYLLFITAMGFPVRIGSECILITAICCIIAQRRWPETVSEIGTEVPKDEGLALVPA